MRVEAVATSNEKLLVARVLRLEACSSLQLRNPLFSVHCVIHPSSRASTGLLGERRRAKGESPRFPVEAMTCHEPPKTGPTLNILKPGRKRRKKHKDTLLGKDIVQASKQNPWCCTERSFKKVEEPSDQDLLHARRVNQNYWKHVTSESWWQPLNKLLGTSASLLVTSALLVVTRS